MLKPEENKSLKTSNNWYLKHIGCFLKYGKNFDIFCRYFIHNGRCQEGSDSARERFGGCAAL